MKKISGKALWARLSFIVLGLASTAWFLFRVIPKPSRATYPCMKAAAPFMSGFVVYILSIAGSAFAIRLFHKKLQASKYVAATALLAATFVMIVAANVSTSQESKAATLVEASYFEANNPVGTANGLKPGRVVWVWNKNATNEKFTPSNNKSNWWAYQTNKEEVSKMFDKAILSYSDASTLSEAWDAMFKYFNEQQGKGSVGYTAGEKIYIKVNITNSANGMTKTQNFDRMDLTPEMALILLRHLIEEVGVAQSDIYLGDPFRNFHNLYWDMCHSVYPDVNYCDGRGLSGRHQTVPTTEHAMKFSDKKLDFRIPQEYVDASYIINMPCLKTHNEGGITIGAKNHQGSVLQDNSSPADQYIIDMHYSLPKNDPGYGKYRHLVDYLGHKDVGGKTLVTIVDGIWAGRSWEGFVEKWTMAPFNNDYPNSIFISQDKVAIDAVCYDFLLEEYKNKPSSQKYPYFEGCDDYLLQAADPANWAEGITYDPEGDGTPLASLGVYEHWNNASEMKYSRNLGAGNGIELVKVNLANDHLTPDNSGLASAKVNTIFIDSFNVKWFGTDNGISRYNDIAWDQINTSNHLRENTVNDIKYEKTRYGDEVWVATHGGLSVMSYNIDGVTSATTYHVGGPESGIINDTITAVGLDKNHFRWIATPVGINTFGKNGWDTIKTFINFDHDTKDWGRLEVNSIASYEKDGSVYMGTSGQGVIRMSYNEVDGFTGASAMSSVWSGLWSDTIHAVSIYDTVQWYGTNEGVFAHFGPSTKGYWDYSINPWDNIMNPIVRDIEKDDKGNIWFGTENGICVSTQASNINIVPKSSTQASISWTTGKGFITALPNEYINDLQKDEEGKMWIATNNGVRILNTVPESSSTSTIKRVVFISESIVQSIIPFNWTTYTANAEYKKGSAIGNWYCIYNGTGTSVEVTGLSPNTTYWVAVFDYQGEPGVETYSIAEGEKNPESFLTLPVSADAFTRGDIRAYPVPFNEYLNISFDGEKGKTYEITISDLEGKVFKKVKANGMTDKINTSGLSKGAYILKVSDGKQERTIKVIK